MLWPVHKIHLFRRSPAYHTQRNSRSLPSLSQHRNTPGRALKVDWGSWNDAIISRFKIGASMKPKVVLVPSAWKNSCNFKTVHQPELLSWSVWPHAMGQPMIPLGFQLTNGVPQHLWFPHVLAGIHHLKSPPFIERTTVLLCLAFICPCMKSPICIFIHTYSYITIYYIYK